MTKWERFKEWMGMPMSKTCWLVITIAPWIILWGSYYVLKAYRIVASNKESRKSEEVEETCFVDEQ